MVSEQKITLPAKYLVDFVLLVPPSLDEFYHDRNNFSVLIEFYQCWQIQENFDG